RRALRLAADPAAARAVAAGTDFCSAALGRSTTMDVRERIEARSRPPRTAWLRRWCESTADALAARFDARRTGGRVREGHGDLHLANLVVLEGDDATAFDCIELDRK